MAEPRKCLRALLLAILSSRAAALTLPAELFLLGRQSTCPSNFSQCGGSLPTDFCCQAGSTCIALAGNTTALCCPSGETCQLVAPITCDLSQQNVQFFPTSPIKTTALNGILPICGNSMCCPFGYTCNENGSCLLNANQNAVPIQLTPTSTATTSTASAKTSAPAVSVSEVATSQLSGTATPSAVAAAASSSPSSSPSATPAATGSSKTAAIAGSIAAILGALLLIFFAWLCVRRRRRAIMEEGARKEGKARRTGSVKSNGTERSWGNTGPLPRPSPRRIRADQIQPPQPVDIQRSDFAALIGRASSGSGFSDHEIPPAGAGVNGSPNRGGGAPPRTPSSRRSNGSSMTGIRPLRLAQKHGLAGGVGGVQASPGGRTPTMFGGPLVPVATAATATPPRVESPMTIPIGIRDSRQARASTMTDWGGFMEQAGEETPPVPTAGQSLGASPSRRR